MLLLLVAAVVLLISLLMLVLVLFAAVVVVLVPSFFGDDAPFAEDILLNERSPFEFSLVVVVVGKKNVCSSSSFWVFSLPLLLLINEENETL